MFMLTKILLKMQLGILTTKETLSRLDNLGLSSPAKKHSRAGTFLTESEVRSLREEMKRDGELMKKWLATIER
jgi:outer membrane protein assembly factor BamE (lipoprotein component of BamABCDE complex)